MRAQGATDTVKKICVFGAGAIGGHLAAKLARAGLDVSVVARGAHLQAIREKGLRFTSDTEDFVTHPNATSDTRELGPQDLVITTLKAHALPGAAEQMAPLLGRGTPVVFAVNGIPWWYPYRGEQPALGPVASRLDPQGALWKTLGANRAIGCVISSPNEVIAPGVVHNNRPHNSFIVGEPTGQMTERLTALVTALQPALPGVAATTDIRTAMWNKLILNLAGSPLSCLVDAPWIEFTGNPGMVRIFTALVNEATRVAAAHGVAVTTTAEQLLALMQQVRHVPSMLADLRAKRPLETDAILGAVQDLARAAGIDTPTLDIIAALLEQRARSLNTNPQAATS
ncbi:ketopantoate reductase family protein [Caenimonas aquaedulcis]|uniref:2-dehydropantoate 2-reductase n=1 Tax=Caenimonas aquaedulcis TaxID=2793270 RepID=A0A931H8C2_9BURK|nr:2-dehydropantoate 2-reductase [Caenimonas aquaedulcis]